MSLNNSEEDSDHLAKLQEQNGEEYKDAAEKENSGRPKKVFFEQKQRKQKKGNNEETEKDANNKKYWNDNKTIDLIDMLKENT